MNKSNSTQSEGAPMPAYSNTSTSTEYAARRKKPMSWTMQTRNFSKEEDAAVDNKTAANSNHTIFFG